MTGSAYRRDIDGLRAVAIVPVLFYHAGVASFSGGYVGVDIFFVISGYLIAGIIAREVDTGQFSIIRFYERRARRIMPALTAMMAVALIAAALFFLPGDLAKVPRSALFTTLFLSNAYFFHETGYFAGGAETMPLLHTWSLAVEEQFYLGFPLLLILIARYRAAWRAWVVAGLTLLSFALAVITEADGTGSAFYLLPARAWELFVGALLALGVVPDVRGKAVRELLSLAGAAAIGWAVFSFTPKTVFPGVNALYPVLGAATLIHCAPGSRAGKVLGSTFMVGVGLISYSLYLWHWPLIVFSEYLTDAPLGGWRSVAVITGAVLLAILSWRYIERPFRNPETVSRRHIFAATGATMGLLIAVSGIMMTKGGWPGRFTPEVLRLANARSDISPARAFCITREIGGLRPRCTLGAAVTPTALLWGDSHGVEFAWVLGEQARGEGRAIIQRTRASCPPIPLYRAATDPLCPAFNSNILSMLRANPGIRTVYLVAFWASESYATPDTARQLSSLIDYILGLHRRVVLIGPVPPQHVDVPRYLAHAAQRGVLAAVRGVSRPEVDARTTWLTSSYPRWRAQGVTIIEPADTLCDAKDCAIIHDGAPLYFDSHHLSVVGARLVLTTTH